MQPRIEMLVSFFCGSKEEQADFANADIYSTETDIFLYKLMLAENTYHADHDIWLALLQ